MAGDRLSDAEVAQWAAAKLGGMRASLAREVQAHRAREREADALLRRCVESVEWPDTLDYLDRRMDLRRDLRAFLKEG